MSISVKPPIYARRPARYVAIQGWEEFPCRALLCLLLWRLLTNIDPMTFQTLLDIVIITCAIIWICATAVMFLVIYAITLRHQPMKSRRAIPGTRIKAWAAPKDGQVHVAPKNHSTTNQP